MFIMTDACKLATEELVKAFKKELRDNNILLDDAVIKKHVDEMMQKASKDAKQSGDLPAAIDRSIATVGQSVMKSGKHIAEFNKIKSNFTSGTDAYHWLLAKIATLSIKTFDKTDIATETAQKVYQADILNPFMDIVSEIPDISDPATARELVDGLFDGGLTNTDITNAGKQIKQLLDKVNAESDIKLTLSPYVNNKNLTDMRNELGDDAVRDFFRRHLVNGDDFIAQLEKDNWQHLTRNQMEIDNADSYLEIINAFNNNHDGAIGSIAEAFRAHGKRMASYDNWGATPKYALRMILDDRQVRKMITPSQASKLERYMNNVTLGEHSNFDNHAAMRFLKGMRGWAAMAQLGRAVFLTPLDRAVAHTIIKSVGGKQKRSFARPFASQAERDIGMMYGIGLDSRMSDYFAGINSGRFIDVEGVDGGKVYEFNNNLTRKVMKVYGIQSMSDNVKWQFASEMQYTVGTQLRDNVDYFSLNSTLRTELGNVGIDARTWEGMIASKNDFMQDGVINPQLIADADTRKKFMAMIIEMTDRAVTQPTLVDQPANWLFHEGTLQNELVKSLTQYTNFVVKITKTQIRAFNNAEDPIDKLIITSRYAGAAIMTAYLIDNLKEGTDIVGDLLFDQDSNADEAWDRMMANLSFQFAGDPHGNDNRIDQAWRMARYSAIGGGLMEAIVPVLGLPEIAKDLAGYPVHRHQDRFSLYGPSLGVPLKIITGALHEGIVDGPVEGLARAGHDAINFVPGSSLPLVRNLIRENVKEPLREWYRN